MKFDVVIVSYITGHRPSTSFARTINELIHNVLCDIRYGLSKGLFCLRFSPLIVL